MNGTLINSTAAAIGSMAIATLTRISTGLTIAPIIGPMKVCRYPATRSV